MKTKHFSLVLPFGAMVLALPNPQSTPDLSTLPTCAQAAALQAVSSSGCALTAAECFCKNQDFIEALQQAITNGCGGSDQASACAWGTAACSAFGISLPCDASARPPATDAAVQGSSVTASDTVPTSMTAVSGDNSLMTSMSSTDNVRSLATSSSTSVMSNNGTWTSPTSTGGPAQFTGAAGAAVNTYPGFISIVAGVAMVFAFL